MAHTEDVLRQLSVIEAEVQSINPGIYRDLALYLQVLREGLLNAVRQACFHLATRFYPDRYCELPPEHRAGLHERIAELVQRCCSVLTVEQLVQLAGQIGRERLLQEQRRQREWLAQLGKAGDELSGGTSAAVDGAHLGGHPLDRIGMPENPPGRQGSDPVGSIRLNAALPLDMDRWQALMAVPAEPSTGPEEDVEAELSATPGQTGNGGEGLDPLAGLLEGHGEAVFDSLLEAAAPAQFPPPWDSAVLPSDPQALQVWLEGFERALVRRLRNLSHALNVELLRSGLSRSLLPNSLLQAALQGQLEPQAAPANLLRLQVPLAPDGGGEIDSVAVLLRLSDLEVDQPRLRNCRSRWQRHRQQVRRMAERHRHLRRQLQRLEAERLWLQDNPSPLPMTGPRSTLTKPG